jgi:hypothetical protein
VNHHFQALEKKIERRQRALNALASVSHWVTISLGLSLVYLGIVTLGLLPPQWPLWALGLFNILIGLVGWLVGRLRPIDLAAALFQVDRAMGTGEALCTYHEYSGSRARRPFTQRLEEAINTILVKPSTALPITRHQRRALLTITGLVVAYLWLGSLGPLHVMPTGLAGVARHNVENTATEAQSKAPQPQNFRELQQFDTQAGQLEKQLRIEAPPVERRTAAAELTALYQKLRDAQQELWKLPNGSSSPSATPTEGATEQPQMNSTTDQPEQAEARRLADARQAAQALQQALKQTLNTLQEQGQTGASDSGAIQQALERLAQQAPNEEIRQSLTRAIQAKTSQEQQQLISKAQQQLQDLLKQDQQLEHTQQEIARTLREGGQRPTPSGDTAQANGASSPESNSQASDSQEGAANSGQYTGGGKRASDTGEGKGTTNRPSGTADQATQPSGGDQPGTQEGANVQEAPSDQTLPPQRQLVITHDRLPSDAQLQTVMLSKGVPFETVSSSPDSGMTLRYDFAKAESLLKLRGVPPTLRDLIRQYFVAITAEQPRQP